MSKARLKPYKIALLVTIAVSLIVCAVLVIGAVSRQRKYDEAITLMGTDLVLAASEFSALGDYKDAPTLAGYARMRSASASGDYAAVIREGSSLGDYKNTAAYLHYAAGMDALKKGDYSISITELAAAGSLEDAALHLMESRMMLAEKEDRTRRSQYDLALSTAQAGDYVAAMVLFESLGGYADSAVQAALCKDRLNVDAYDIAVGLYQSGDMASAREAFAALGSYADSLDYLKKIDDGGDME